MPNLDLYSFISKIACKSESTIKVIGIQNGKFILTADYFDQTYILAQPNGKHREFRNINEILRLLRRETHKTEITLNIKIWDIDTYQDQY